MMKYYEIQYNQGGSAAGGFLFSYKKSYVTNNNHSLNAGISCLQRYRTG